MSTTLRNRIAIQSLSATANEGGTFIENWSTVTSVWATVNGNAKENLAYEKEQQMNYYTIRIRKQNISNNNRILFNEKILVIESVLDDTSRNNYMLIKAREEKI
jgi:SPP1 family predicted phage head-tail adaptor